MKSNLYINGEDALEKYGIIAGGDCYKGLVQYPNLKKVESNNWPEEDGIDPDLSNPCLDTKEFSIDFYRTHKKKNIDELLLTLYSEPYHLFFFPELNRTFKLRLVNGQNIRMFKELDRISLTFADDFPLEEYKYSLPLLWGLPEGDYDLDGRCLTDYGVKVLDGSDDEIEKSPAVKRNLLVSLNSRQGATYYGEKVVFESKDVKIKCLLKAPDIESFWTNYNALLYDLTKTEERYFYTDKLVEEFPCHYKSSTVNRFEILPGGGVWCDFTLTLVFISFRVGDLSYLLASENNKYIITQDDNYYIDMKNYGSQKD